MECAQLWLQYAQTALPPPELAALFSGWPSLSFEKVEPEAPIPFDQHGGPRQADLKIWAKDGKGPVAVTVEAKGDETFDATLARSFDEAIEERRQRPNSRRLDRLRDLVLSILPTRARGTQAASNLRYQLLTGVAGTLAFAQENEATRAVFIVEVFETLNTSRAKLNSNAADLDNFVGRLTSGARNQLNPGILAGPFTVPGAPLFNSEVELYLGKVIHHLGDPQP